VTASFPEQHARTQAFHLGRPQLLTLSRDGRRLFFLRSTGGDDPVRRLWELDLGTGEERLLLDPLTLGDAGAAPSAQERARRERARDRGAGIVDYSFDPAVRVMACTFAQELVLVDPATGTVTRPPARTPLTDATISPDGGTVAYVHAGALRVTVTGRPVTSRPVTGRPVTGRPLTDRCLAEPETADVTYGLAEHVAAESMHRQRGYWWSPEGDRLAVCRVDNAPVATWYLTDPSRPGAAPTAYRYPAAGTANARVTLHVLDLDGGRVDVDFGWPGHEYLVEVVWDRHGLLAVLQNRPQTELRIVAVDPGTGRTTVLAENHDPAWTQIVPGVPARTEAGALIWTADRGDTRHLTVDGEPVTPDGLQVAEVHSVDGDTVLFGASSEPTELHLWTWSPGDGARPLTTEAGRHTGLRAGGTTVISAATLAGHAVTAHGRTVGDLSAPSPVSPAVTLLRAGERELRTALLLPTGWTGGPLPVLMDPYGGPAAQRAVADRDRYHVSQWFADQGFAVIVADGRGTPGRGPRWERAIHLDRTTALLEDQVDALHAVAARHPDLDLTRVGIRGWSAGGSLAALAVLRRPDVFHAAVAGAPVTDHLLYDTHWQERFLGDPRIDPGPYRSASLIEDAPRLRRPLMLIHGLLDDNVHPAHTMRLSAALLAAGREHTVLPLPAATHMGAGADLLTPQLNFLRKALGVP
jgi:dipeptidyl-peptidase-4